MGDGIIIVPHINISLGSHLKWGRSNLLSGAYLLAIEMLTSKASLFLVVIPLCYPDILGIVDA